MIIETIAVGVIATAIGSISGYFLGAKKRELSEKEKTINEFVRCPALMSMISTKQKSQHNVRCELDNDHIGPHKHTVEDIFINAGQVMWWNDEEKPPEKKALKRVK